MQAYDIERAHHLCEELKALSNIHYCLTYYADSDWNRSAGGYSWDFNIAFKKAPTQNNTLTIESEHNLTYHKGKHDNFTLKALKEIQEKDRFDRDKYDELKADKLVMFLLIKEMMEKRMNYLSAELTKLEIKDMEQNLIEDVPVII